jgi:HK97 family phage major capsid protein
LEADKFLNGAGHGSSEPQGLLTGATITVDSEESSGVTVGDFTGLAEALPPRFTPGASYLSSLAVANQARRLSSASGSPTGEPEVLDAAYSRLLGKAWYELSEVPGDGTTSDDVLAILGNIRAGFTIVDRLGLSTSVVPHVPDPSTGLPTGESGLVALWRNSSVVHNPNAIRVLVRK